MELSTKRTIPFETRSGTSVSYYNFTTLPLALDNFPINEMLHSRQTGRITVLRKNACFASENARAFRPRDENGRCVGDLISRINVALFNFKNEAHFASQTRNKLRDNHALLNLASKAICTLRAKSSNALHA